MDVGGSFGGGVQAGVAVKAIDSAVADAADVPWNCVDRDELAEAVARLEVTAAKLSSLRDRVLAEATPASNAPAATAAPTPSPASSYAAPPENPANSPSPSSMSPSATNSPPT